MWHWEANPLNGPAVLGMVIGGVVILILTLLVVMYSIYWQRKLIGWIQWRIGPNRVGPFGLLQTAADVIKLLIKEDVVPEKADRAMFLLAPIIAFVPAFTVLAAIPFSAHHVFTANISIGALFYVALSAITIHGVMLGAWASNNKYSLIGGMRSAAQLISYEIPLGLSIVGVVLMAGSINLNDIVEAQAKSGLWYVIPQILGFIVFMIASTAELSRTPFDLPEAESELVAGYHTEYSGFRFAFFMLTEYVYLFAMAGLFATLYLGGWSGPLLPGWLWFAIKAFLYISFQFWLQATMPRMRVDQLMSFSWKVLLPLALVNIVITAVVKAFV
ncbi:NADH-quinone oxidoreductase subunit NuoH [Alicyclobacillus macrosporangiidus]|jgi:NADH-quinone oxidoreductase subunit H|uniref:NADH-quinone oxidoreductase subunit H n=2 Tax=Alicyclobacillus macrosporangiidus TaxID=392015 RepID=A0A1I7HX54_9BACL|nr:NADH-quinone oxidoreductase subunit NuoH [Alicyclobacillus macrosporangiidus]SFU65219.1 NADH-quinone oxidoreductase subunit H [Alicyclobacillus macrosporangiidus]